MVADGAAPFCRSAQAAPKEWHVPVDEKIEDTAAADLRAMLLPHVIRYCEESTSLNGRTSITSDLYLKVSEQSRPDDQCRFSSCSTKRSTAMA